MIPSLSTTTTTKLGTEYSIVWYSMAYTIPYRHSFSGGV